MGLWVICGIYEKHMILSGKRIAVLEKKRKDTERVERYLRLLFRFFLRLLFRADRRLLVVFLYLRFSVRLLPRRPFRLFFCRPLWFLVQLPCARLFSLLGAPFLRFRLFSSPLVVVLPLIWMWPLPEKSAVITVLLTFDHLLGWLPQSSVPFRRDE